MRGKISDLEKKYEVIEIPSTFSIITNLISISIKYSIRNLPRFLDSFGEAFVNYQICLTNPYQQLYKK